MKRINTAFYTLDEFRRLVSSLYDETVYLDAELDGLHIGLSEDDVPAEDLHERLAAVLQADEVTSVHIDDYEPCGVWVAYKDRNIINRADYIASKLWCDEDVASVLKERGYEATPEEVTAVINSGYLDVLNDCTDGDWEAIHLAVSEAEKRGTVNMRRHI